MSSVEETAYPRLRDEVSVEELEQLYTPTPKERRFVTEAYRRPMPQALLMLQIKLVQRLGYSVPMADVPISIVAHVCRKLRVTRPTREQLDRYDGTGEKGRHFGLVLQLLNLRQLDAEATGWLSERAHEAAKTKQELPDIINVLLEELVSKGFILPGYTVLDKLARTAREAINSAIYDRVFAHVSPETRGRLDALLVAEAGKTDWDRLKKEPGRPTTREVASFLQHIRWLEELADGLPSLSDVAATKLSQMTLEARALDAAEMRSTQIRKRYTLAVLLIQSQLRKSTDDVAEMFIKTVRKLDSDANKRLQAYHLEQVKQVDRLIGQLRDMLSAYQTEEEEQARLAAIQASLISQPQQLIEECDEYMAFAGNNYFPFMLPLYRTKRALLFECLEVMRPQPTYKDSAFALSLTWLLAHRTSHKEYLDSVIGDAALDLRWLPDKWRKLVVSKDEAGQVRVHRKFLELSIFERVQEELQSGDLFIADSDQYDDYREHFVDDETLQRELPAYAAMLGIPQDGASFVSELKGTFEALTLEIDETFPGNTSVAWGPGGLTIRKPASDTPPDGLDALDYEINERLGFHSVLDVLVQTEQWLDLHKLFGPLSGYESKIDDPRARCVATLFCYGFNMGASQTARSLKGFSRKQIAWLNLHNVTEERLDKAIVKTINAYNRFGLPKYWGSGKTASADGTKWSMYEQNLLSEYHIRYGGYGGIGYYHVSDTYIALFSHFIPCGVYEAVYILDGLIRNDSDIQPDTLHGDTQAQNTPVFGLANLLGIDLMPRIRNIKDLIFYRPSRETRFTNIQPLFAGPSVDWELIERHYEDMLRVAVSIKAGKITPSTLLRRLGSASRKNKLYFAFRELGRARRTMFLLRYISDPQLRKTINAATNKSEEFNNFAQWTFFGNQGVIAENVRHEQRKVVKYNHLVTNMLILNNVHRMSGVLAQLRREGKHQIDEKTLGALSPYRNIHLNRYGDYTMDLRIPVEPMNVKIKIL
jgi:TnpA family transposase